MNTFAAKLFSLIALVALAACGNQEPGSTPAGQAAPSETVTSQPAVPAVEGPENGELAEDQAEAPAQPGEVISETDDAPAPEQSAATVHPAVRVGGPSAGPATSSRFREGRNYQKIVPAQPTQVAPGKVEVTEVFWYGCPHCFALDPAIESWRNKGKPSYVEFVRIPAMWNEMTRLHARLFYATELLGKLDELHSAIFRQINVDGNRLDTVDKIAAFFKEHGVSAEEFNKAFSSFAVESKLQRADFLNRRYRIQSVPTFVVNGKYTTDVGSAGGEPQLFDLIEELAAHEHGG